MVINSQSDVTPRRPPSAAATLTILCGAPFLASLDLFVVNVAFDQIGTSFPGHSLADMSWVLSGYAIVYAALLIPLGRWADNVGHKRVFLMGLAVFTVASAAAAVSPGLWALVGFRLLQAVGAAALTPTSLGLLLNSVPLEKRAISVRIWAAVSGAAAAAFGPVVGGLLVEVSWRWIFLINIPFGIVLLIAGTRVLAECRTLRADSKLDLFGAVLLAVGIGALTTAIVQGHDWGWTSSGVIAAFVVAVVASIGFLLNNSRRRSPLVDPSLFRLRTFTWSNIGALVFSASFAAGLLGLVLWLQTVWDYSAVRTGLAITPGPIMVPIFAMVGQALTKRFKASTLAFAGSVLWAAGTVLILLSVDSQPDYVTAVLPGWLLSGIGVGLTLPTILSSATAQLPPTSAATGSAVVNMTRQIGTVLGISGLIALIGSPIGFDAAHEAFQRAWWAVAATGLLSAVVAFGLTPRSSVAPSPVPGSTEAENTPSVTTN
ncbi:DHA2 family efflux MFS transporter permease subunit [Rhodococcus sp. ABRD24]|uniref:MFS transporter n=1 Tax=Rhodococcus sp. ABRD24 TaxID=2507582 RepID=UPI00103FB3B5|nr:MFS transporter [Rhodococcus sp. ABRD24]QBJ98857.1 DHA2 family efflux MFS transporter permease subunit [Rhodococcus sp. ABRD24]